jgi:chromosome segregation ATPase
MTTIKASEYSPTAALNPLTPGQVTLLNKGAANDISQRVKTIVQTHLGYQGNEEFRTTFTKKEVTFTLKTGPATENRTLKLVNGHWMLSQNSTAPAALDPTVEAEVNTLITEILANIGKASRANVPDPVHSTATVDAVDGKVSSDDNSELAQIKVKLASLENQLRSNLTLEHSLEVQRQILNELTGLKFALEKQSHGNNTEELRRHLAQLQQALAEKEKEFQNLIREAAVQFNSMQKGFEDEKKKFQEALKAKNQQACELQQKVDALEKAVSQKEAKILDEKSSLEKQLQKIEELQKIIGEKDTNFQDLTKEAGDEFERMQTGIIGEKEKFQEAVNAKVQKARELQQQIAQLEAAVSQKEEEQAQALEELELVKAEKELIQEQLQAAHKISLNQAEVAVQNNESIVQLNIAISHLQNSMAIQTKSQDKLLAEKASLEQQLENAQAKLNNTAQQLKELQTVNVISHSNNEKNVATLHHLSRSNNELGLLGAQKTAEVEALRKENSRLQAEIASVQKVFTENSDQLKKAAQMQETLSSELDYAKAQEMQALVNLQESHEENSRLQENTARLESINTELNSEKTTAMQTIQQLKDSLKAKEQQLDTVEKEKFEAELTALNNTDYDILQEELASTQNTFTAQVSSLTEQLRIAELTNEISTQTIQQLKDSLKAKEQQLVAAVENLAQMKSELDQATEMQETLQTQNTNLISNLKLAKKSAEDSTLTLQESLRKKEGQLEDTRIELEEALIDRDEVKVDAKEAKESVKKINDAFLEAQRTIESLEEERRQLEAAIEQAQREIRYLRPRVNDELDIKQPWKNNENRS